MSKKIITNTWSDGLNKDLTPNLTPNTVLTDNLNGTFITYNGNELSLQNDMGNIQVSELSDGFYPIGVQEFGDIIYIISIKDDDLYKISLSAQYDSSDKQQKLDIIKLVTGLNTRNASDLLEGTFYVDTVKEANKIISRIKDLDFISNINFSDRIPVQKFEIGSFPSLPDDAIEEQPYPLEYKYRPFKNLLVNGDVRYFSTSFLEGYDKQHPVSMEIQPSYDGSVNIIFTDDKNIPRIINSGFSVLENGQGKRTKRNQVGKTNYYLEEDLNSLTALILGTKKFPYVNLGTANDKGEVTEPGVKQGGRLKGGNYTFYVQFGDEDGNKTDIVCESGVVSIFKGTPGDPSTISGAWQSELTDKLIVLTVNDIDPNYSRIYLSYTREYCDANGYRLTEAKEIVDPYAIINGEDISYKVITISGEEMTIDRSIEDLNIKYYSISSAKTMAQQQNMLFLGNITTSEVDNAILQRLSYEVEVGISQSESIGNVSVFNYEPSEGAEYYDPQNIYYSLGYWPDELYRLGIVYINNDGTTTQAFNLKGCYFTELGETNMDENHVKVDVENVNTMLDKVNPIFLNGTTTLDNIAGVFRTPDVNVLIEGDVRPIYFEFEIPDSTQKSLSNLGIIGYFIVRQKRLPITICQGFGIGIDRTCFIPMLKYEDSYITESFLTSSDTHDSNEDTMSRRLIYTTININKGDVDVSENCVNYIGYRWKPDKKDKGWWQGTVVGKKGNDLDYKYCWYQTTDRVKKGSNKSDEKLESLLWYCRHYASEHDIHLEPGLELLDVFNYNAQHQGYSYDTSSDPDNPGQESYAARKERKIEKVQEKGYGLLSLDAMTNPTIQSTLCGSSFTLDPINKCDLNRNKQLFMAVGYETTDKENLEGKLTYIPQETYTKIINGVGFSTKVGDGVNIDSFGFVDGGEYDKQYEDKVVRGNYTPFIGVVTETTDFEPNYLYNIRSEHDPTYTLDFVARSNNYAEYYAITNKTSLEKSVIGFRGDCFTNTVTIRMNSNFIDDTAPVADVIVDQTSWKDNYYGKNNVSREGEEKKDDENNKTDWSQMNLTDLNTVSLGHWITFKCLSSSNLGLRSEDTFHVNEMALLGNPRGFYPFYGASTDTRMKMPDSTLLNNGYSATVSRRRNILNQDIAYNKNEFSNRIMFSNVSVTDSFTNGYRTFQGASYGDYAKQFGAIVKILPWGNNLFCVFEHGLAILPVNEKALMQTTTEATIHIYGHGVLPDQPSIISQDLGSIWQDSIVRTPVGIYGVDTFAKKIWRYTDQKGLETLSDLKIQRFLNDKIDLGLNKQVDLGVTNVKTHFNNYKGDLMFTFYNEDNKWNICYNERQGIWVTRYDWIPLQFANINNTFYTFDLESGDSIWKHGRTGIDYQMLPTMWYGKQHPFEFEFIVNEPQGLHKIFENLIILSNNVQPEELEFELIGDAYLFNKARIYHDFKQIYGNKGEDIPYKIDKNYRSKDDYAITWFKPMFYNATVNYDNVLDEYTLVVNQKCKNAETYGRRLGNIQYKEDAWYTNIEPLRYNAKLKDSSIWNFDKSDPFVNTKLRDKWVKIRIKYKGDQLAIVNAISTIENLSYS